jgi:hypothetical protein
MGLRGRKEEKKKNERKRKEKERKRKKKEKKRKRKKKRKTENFQFSEKFSHLNFSKDDELASEGENFLELTCISNNLN